MQRQNIKAMLRGWDKEQPGRVETILEVSVMCSPLNLLIHRSFRSIVCVRELLMKQKLSLVELV